MNVDKIITAASDVASNITKKASNIATPLSQVQVKKPEELTSSLDALACANKYVLLEPLPGVTPPPNIVPYEMMEKAGYTADKLDKIGENLYTLKK